jgi:hypothetical protein
MNPQIPTLTAILLLAWLTEAIVEYAARPWLKPAGRTAPGEKPLTLRYAAMGLGVLLAVAYQADLLALVGLISPISPYVGYVVTGLVIGRGSNFLHDLADRWLAPLVPSAPTIDAALAELAAEFAAEGQEDSAQ